jgi:large conductance mechanosensitive channel
VIIAFVVFLLTKVLLREKPPPTPATKSCPECTEVVAKEARRCKWCTAQIG